MALRTSERGTGIVYLCGAMCLSAAIGLPLGAVWCRIHHLTWWMVAASLIIGGLAALCTHRFYQAAICSCVCVVCSLFLPTADAAQNPKLLWDVDTFVDMSWMLSLVALAGCGTVWWVWRPRLDALAKTPEDRCESCGYDLHGNVSGRCPECGTPRQGMKGG